MSRSRNWSTLPKRGCHEIVAIVAIAACRSFRTGGFQSENAAAWCDGVLRLRVFALESLPLTIENLTLNSEHVLAH